jgi:hypothetical protein
MTRHLPFSTDYEREEAFALGVINGKSSGFRDTLRQFRIADVAPRPDSLTPLAQRSEPPGALPHAPPRRFASLAVSLTVGFAVGVVIAFVAISLRAPSHAATAAAPTPTPMTTPATVPTTAALPPPTPAPTAEPDSAPRTVATPTLHPPRPAKGPLAAARAVPTPEQNRRWLLDHARSEQRQYRITAAERLYRQILARSPQDSEALSGLGELELLRGTVDLADQHFQAALDANAHYIPALIAAADIRWQSGRIEEARQAYLHIVDHYSADSYPPYVALRSVPTATPVCER